METIINAFTQFAIEAIIVVVGTLASIALAKAKHYLDGLRKKDELGIIDLITDRVVEYAEAELKGQAGIDRRDFAVKKAIEILASKGIKVNEDEVIAGIENGVIKLKMNKGFLTPFQTDSVDGLNQFLR